MADKEFENEVLQALVDEGAAIGILAQDDKAFAATYKAFRARDARAFKPRWSAWTCSSAGSRSANGSASRNACSAVWRWAARRNRSPDPRLLAEGIVRHHRPTRAVLKRLVEAVEKRDRDASAASSWRTSSRRMPPVLPLGLRGAPPPDLPLVCSPMRPWRPDFIGGAVVGRPGAAPAARARATSSTRRSPRRTPARPRAARSCADRTASPCIFICEWFCSWRCALGCLTLCGSSRPSRSSDPIGEAYEFARSTREVRPSGGGRAPEPGCR